MGRFQRLSGEPANMHTQKLRCEEDIHALTSKLWFILTTTDCIQQFFFGGDLFSDWRKDSSIFGDKEEKIPRGQVEEMIPGIYLGFRLDGIPELNLSSTTFEYEIVPSGDGIQLQLSIQASISSEELLKTLRQQCRMMVKKIKWLAEFS